MRKQKSSFGYLLAIAICAMMLGIPVTAKALTINTYTDRAIWQAAATPFAGSLSTEDFNDEPYYTWGQTVLDFDGFTSTSGDPVNPPVVAPGNSPYGTTIDGTNHLMVARGYANRPDLAFSWDFDDPIAAIGFDWRNTDSNSTLNLQVDTQIFNFGTALGAGFFGFVITDGAVDSVVHNHTGNNLLLRGSYDNVQFGSPVPEPATMLLLGTGLIGLAGARRKKFGK